MPFGQYTARVVILGAVLSIIAIFGLGAIGAGTVWLWVDQSNYRSEQEREQLAETVARAAAECHREVRSQELVRIMWVELFDKFPGEPIADELRSRLDALVPPLECANNIPVTKVLP